MPLDRRRFLHVGFAFGATACAGEVRVTFPPGDTGGQESESASSSPAPGTGPGSLGPLDELRRRVADEEFVQLVQFDAWLVAYPPELVEQAKLVYPSEMHESIEAGLLALRWRCPHLGCRVPECRTSGQFECPCHRSMYSGLGEYRGGPSPRGLDLMPLTVRDGMVSVQGGIVPGLDRAVDVSNRQPRGPGCVGLGPAAD